VIDTVTVENDILHYESTLAKSRFKTTLGERGVSLGKACPYCRQM